MNELMTFEQVSNKVGMTRPGITKAIKEGRFPEPVKVAGRVLWDASWIEAYLAGENVRPYNKDVAADVPVQGVPLDLISEILDIANEQARVTNRLRKLIDRLLPTDGSDERLDAEQLEKEGIEND